MVGFFETSTHGKVQYAQCGQLIGLSIAGTHGADLG